VRKGGAEVDLHSFPFSPPNGQQEHTPSTSDASSRSLFLLFIFLLTRDPPEFKSTRRKRFFINELARRGRPSSSSAPSPRPSSSRSSTARAARRFRIGIEEERSRYGGHQLAERRRRGRRDQDREGYGAEREEEGSCFGRGCTR